MNRAAEGPSLVNGIDRSLGRGKRSGVRQIGIELATKREYNIGKRQEGGGDRCSRKCGMCTLYMRKKLFQGG